MLWTHAHYLSHTFSILSSSYHYHPPSLPLSLFPIAPGGKLHTVIIIVSVIVTVLITLACNVGWLLTCYCKFTKTRDGQRAGENYNRLSPVPPHSPSLLPTYTEISWGKPPPTYDESVKDILISEPVQ